MSGNQPEQNHYDSYNQKDMYEPADSIGRDDPEEPENKQDNRDFYQHKIIYIYYSILMNPLYHAQNNYYTPIQSPPTITVWILIILRYGSQVFNNS